MNHPTRKEWEKIEAHEDRRAILDRTDYYAVKGVFDSAGIDFRVTHHGKECSVIILGTILKFDADLKFYEQESIHIREDRVIE